jgi:tetratricopeptide (TPR) repeat protein
MQLQEAYLDTALQLNPNSSHVIAVKGWVQSTKADQYYYQKQYDKCEPELEKAFSSFKRAIKISKNNDFAYYALGMFYNARGLYDLANKCFDRAIKLNPLQLQYYWFQAYCYIFIGEYEKAEQVYIKALEIQSDHIHVLRNYCNMQIILGKIEESQKLLSQLEKHYPEVNFVLFHAKIFALKGEKEKALEIYKKKHIWIYALLGMGDETIAMMKETQKPRRILKESRFHNFHTPIYDKIRSDPRFQEIIKEYKQIYEDNLRKYGDIDL